VGRVFFGGMNYFEEFCVGFEVFKLFKLLLLLSRKIIFLKFKKEFSLIFYSHKAK
jgi:hypothetical protein